MQDIGNLLFYRECLSLFGQKSWCERERGQPGATETKVVTPGKIVPYKCCLPGSNFSMKTDFDTDVLFNQHCHTFCGTSCLLNMKKWKQTQQFINKVKMLWVYIIDVADVDKGQ